MVVPTSRTPFVHIVDMRYCFLGVEHRIVEQQPSRDEGCRVGACWPRLKDTPDPVA